MDQIFYMTDIVMIYHAHQYQLMVQHQHVVQQIIVILAIYYRKQQRQPHQRTVHQKR
jgi:hypothetical protein